MYDYCQAYNPDCEDCSCRYYDIGFGYAMDHNITVNQVYEKIFNDLKAHDDISTGLKDIRNLMANSGSKYNISDFIEPKSKEWLTLEHIDVVLKSCSHDSFNEFFSSNKINNGTIDINKLCLFLS